MDPPPREPLDYAAEQPDGLVGSPGGGARILAFFVGILVFLGGAALALFGGGPPALPVGGAIAGIGAAYIIPAVWPGGPLWAMIMLFVMSLLGMLATLLIGYVGLAAGSGGACCCAGLGALLHLGIARGSLDAMINPTRPYPEPHGFPVEAMEVKDDESPPGPTGSTG